MFPQRAKWKRIDGCLHSSPHGMPHLPSDLQVAAGEASRHPVGELVGDRRDPSLFDVDPVVVQDRFQSSQLSNHRTTCGDERICDMNYCLIVDMQHKVLASLAKDLTCNGRCEGHTDGL